MKYLFNLLKELLSGMCFISKINNHNDQVFKISAMKNKTRIEFNQIENKKEFKKILDDILIYICDNKTQNLVLDLSKINQINSLVKSTDMYLKFLQFLPLFGISNVKFVLTSPESINHLKRVLKRKNNTSLSISYSSFKVKDT